MILKVAELEQALKACSFIQKDKKMAGEWVLLTRTSLISHGISTRIKVDITTEGTDATESFLIHEKTIRDIVSTSKEEKIELVSSKKGVKIKSGSFKAEILTIDLSEFPLETKVSDKSTLKIETTKLKIAIKSVAFAIADTVSSSARIAFTGITLRKDGDKISFIGAKEPLIATYYLDEKIKELDCTFPEEFCRLIDKLPGEHVELSGLGQPLVQIKSGNITAVVNTYITPLPDVSTIVNRATKVTTTLPRGPLIDAINNVSTIREPGKKQRVNITFSKNDIRATVISPILGRASTTIKASASNNIGKDTVRIGLDLANLTAILSKLSKDDVVLQLGEDAELLKVIDDASTYIAIVEIPDTDFEDDNADTT